MFDIILKIILFITPLAYTTGMNLDKFDLIVFQLSVVCLFIASLLSRPKRYRQTQPLAVILVLGFANLALSNFHPIVMTAYSNLFLGIIATALIIFYCEDPRGCAKFVIWASMVNLLVYIAQTQHYEPILANPDGQPGGLLGNAPRMMMYMTIVGIYLPIWAMILFSAIALITGEILFLAIGLFFMFMFIMDKKNMCNKLIKIVFILLAGAGLYYIFPQIRNSFEARWLIWESVIAQTFLKPLAGAGLGMFPHVANQVVPQIDGYSYIINNAFSSFLEFMFNIGLILGGGFIIYIIKYIKERWTTSREMLGVLALGILCLFEYPFEVPKLWLTICAIIAFYFIKNKEIKNA